MHVEIRPMVDAPDILDRNGKVNIICMFRYSVNDC